MRQELWYRNVQIMLSYQEEGILFAVLQDCFDALLHKSRLRRSLMFKMTEKSGIGLRRGDNILPGASLALSFHHHHLLPAGLPARRTSLLGIACAVAGSMLRHVRRLRNNV